MKKKRDFHIPGRGSENIYERELLSELETVKMAMETAYSNFSYVVEPELIDCCIYEIKAVSLRYKFILDKVKSLDAGAAKACMDIKDIKNIPAEDKMGENIKTMEKDKDMEEMIS